jgi:hypothetical protein
LPEAKQIICAYSQNIYNNQAVLRPFMPSDRMISPLNSLKTLLCNITEYFITLSFYSFKINRTALHQFLSAKKTKAL